MCLERGKAHFRTIFASQAVGMRELYEEIWLASSGELDAGLSIDLALF
jgi:hypothetical protein